MSEEKKPRATTGQVRRTLRKIEESGKPEDFEGVLDDWVLLENDRDWEKYVEIGRKRYGPSYDKDAPHGWQKPASFPAFARVSDTNCHVCAPRLVTLTISDADLMLHEIDLNIGEQGY